MNNNSKCKKCSNNSYSIVTEKRKNKTKYFRICDQCGYKKQIHLKRFISYFYSALCHYEAIQVCGNSDFNSVNRQYRQLKKEYEYLYKNLILLLEYIFRNNVQKQHKTLFSTIKLFEILKPYKEPLNDVACKEILDKLN